MHGHTEQNTSAMVENKMTPLPDMMLVFNDHCPSLTTAEHIFENSKKQKVVSAS